MERIRTVEIDEFNFTGHDEHPDPKHKEIPIKHQRLDINNK